MELLQKANNDLNNGDSKLSNFIVKEGQLSLSSHKERLLRKYEENSVPVKAKSFAFNGIGFTHKRINKREYLKSAKERRQYLTNKDKPLFLVTTNIKGCIEESLKGANKKIANQRQMIVNSASLIYNQMK